MVIKLIDSDGDTIYVDPSLVVVIAPEYNDCEKTGRSMINVRTGFNCMRISIDEKPEQVAYLVNNAKADSAKIATLRSLTQKEEADGE
jgi:hypothetical protein